MEINRNVFNNFCDYYDENKYSNEFVYFIVNYTKQNGFKILKSNGPIKDTIKSMLIKEDDIKTETKCFEMDVTNYLKAVMDDKHDSEKIRLKLNQDIIQKMKKYNYIPK